MPKVILSTHNIVVQLLKSGKGNEVAIVGNGHTISLIKERQDEYKIIKSTSEYMPYDLKSYFNSKTTVYMVYFTYDCVSLSSAAKDVAKWIDTFALNLDLKLIGFCQAGLCFYSATNKINPNHKLKLYTIATPFGGTYMIDSEYAANRGVFMSLVHRKYFKGLEIDRDMLPKSFFLQSLKKVECHFEHMNIVTVLKNTSRCYAVSDYLLYLFNVFFMLEGNGVISKDEQYLLKKGCDNVEFNVSHYSALRSVLDWIF